MNLVLNSQQKEKENEKDFSNFIINRVNSNIALYNYSNNNAYYEREEHINNEESESMKTSFINNENIIYNKNIAQKTPRVEINNNNNNIYQKYSFKKGISIIKNKEDIIIKAEKKELSPLIKSERNQKFNSHPRYSSESHFEIQADKEDIPVKQLVFKKCSSVKNQLNDDSEDNESYYNYEN